MCPPARPRPRLRISTRCSDETGSAGWVDLPMSGSRENWGVLPKSRATPRDYAECEKSTAREEDVMSSRQLLEEGTAFAELAALAQQREHGIRSSVPVDERHEVVVIGGGQAGLSAGYHLQRQRVPFVILDARARIGDAWRDRWDSLRLFTPRRLDGLDGMPFPGVANDAPTANEIADHLEA